MVSRNESCYAAVQRTNGKWYRPRKRPEAILLGDENGAEESVLVVRTDDYERARQLACQEVTAWDSGYMPVAPRFGWWRQGIRNRDPYWEYDEGRGAPGYMFEIVERGM